MKKYMLGGTSHIGKSTLAERIAAIEKIKYLSTDRLGRHPGRPWKDKVDLLPEQEQEYYKYTIDYFQNGNIDFLIDDVIGHYSNNIMPVLCDEISNRLSDCDFVAEGSAIMPTIAGKKEFSEISFLFLVSDDSVIANRILRNSSYDDRCEKVKKAIDIFVLRSVAFNKLIYAQCMSLKFPFLFVHENMCDEEIYNSAMEMLRN